MTKMTWRSSHTMAAAAIAVVALLNGLALSPPGAGERATTGRPVTVTAASAPGMQFAKVAGNRGPDLSRVVLARMFQHDHWTIEAVASKTNQEKIGYLCQAFKPLKPTYVSGLIRLNATEPVTPDQVEIFKAVKSCLPGVKLDVVLNAKDYFDGSGHNLQDRLHTITQSLQPDGWFFDFLTKPWQENKVKNMQTGLRWIRNHKMFVGGNVWGSDNIPDHADFVAVTSARGAGQGGLSQAGQLAKKIKQSRRNLPVLLHIQNDPQVNGSDGLRWINASHDHREQILRNHVASTAEFMLDAYMFPVFFPLSCTRPPSSPDRGCAGGGSTYRSYDARADHLLRRICLDLGRDAKHCAEVPRP